MYTISALAKKCSLPRRTLQYWHDNEVMQPLSRAPVAYSNDELALARLLAPFAQAGVNIGGLRELSRIFRLILQEDDSVPKNVARLIKDSRKSGRGYLVVAPELLSDATCNWDWIDVAGDLDRIPRAIKRIIGNRPIRSAAVIDAGYALFGINVTPKTGL